MLADEGKGRKEEENDMLTWAVLGILRTAYSVQPGRNPLAGPACHRARAHLLQPLFVRRPALTWLAAEKLCHRCADGHQNQQHGRRITRAFAVS